MYSESLKCITVLTFDGATGESPRTSLMIHKKHVNKSTFGPAGLSEIQKIVPTLPYHKVPRLNIPALSYLRPDTASLIDFVR